MLPGTLQKTENSRVDMEAARSIVHRQSVSFEIGSSIPSERWRVFTRLLPLDHGNREVGYYFISNDQIEGAAWQVKLSRILCYVRDRGLHVTQDPPLAFP